MKVLVVDDDDDIRLVVLLTLERLGGFDVMAASTGAEALALAAASSFDLILLDVMMPDVDGPETLARLRAQPETQKTPVVFLTAKAMPDEVARLERLGAAAVVTKPFEPAAMAAILRAAVARHRSGN